MANQEERYKELDETFEDELVKFQQRGSIAKLLVQYLQMMTLVKQFIVAVRMSNWNLHLNTIQKILPYFHASGHFLYSQDMLHLKGRMTAEQNEFITTKRYFTIRLSDKFWCDTRLGITIEQLLIRTIKCLSGLTHRRGERALQVEFKKDIRARCLRRG